MFRLLLISLIIPFALALKAQDAPAGIANSNQLILWLVADSISATDSSNINEWRDLSSFNNSALQNTLSNQPLLKKNILNGHHVLEFDGINDFMSLNNHMLSDDIAIYMVINNTIDLHTTTRYAFSSENHEFVSKKAGNPAHEKTGLQYSNSFYQCKDFVRTKYEMLSGQSIGTDDKVYTSKRGDNRIFTNRAALNNNTQTLVGAKFNGTSNIGFHWGNIAEIIIFSDTLNIVERNILMNSLTAKYGSNMDIAQDDYYIYQNSHSHDLIGIGQVNNYAQTVAKGGGAVQLSNPSDLSNGEYLFTGHDNAALTSNSTDIPTGFNSRLNRVWRVDQKGNVGAVDLNFYVDASIIPNLAYSYVLIDDDGDFSNGGTTLHDYGRSLNPSGYISFSSVELPDNAFFTLGSYDINNILYSANSGDWDQALTWGCNCIPDLSSIVRIRGSDVVTISNEASVNILQIGNTATLNLNANSILHIYDSLNIYGQMNNNFNLISVEGNKDVVFSNFRAEAVTFHSLEVSNSKGLTINNANWEIINTLQINSGQLINSGNLLFRSDATLTAQILESVPNSFAGSGEYVLQRYISPRKAEYANFASPVTTTIADWDAEIFMSGVGGNEGNVSYTIHPNGPVFYSVFEYDNINQVHDTIKSIYHSLSPGYAYELFLGDDLLNYTPQEMGVIDVHGTPTTGNVSVPVNIGFCFLGNPYQAFIDWSLVNKPTSMPNSYYVFNANSGNYSLYSSSTPIPPGQGFWVQGPIGGLRTVTFSEDDKLTNTNSNTSTFLRNKYTDTLVLKISNDANPYWHEHFIELNQNSHIQADSNDLPYLPSRLEGVPAIYSTVEDLTAKTRRKLVLNSIGLDETFQSIPITVSAGVTGNYTIDFKNIHILASSFSCIYFEDIKTNKIIDLTKTPSYQFSEVKGKHQRFVLHLIKASEDCSIDKLNVEEMQIVKLNHNYYLNYNLGYNSDILQLKIIDAIGRQVKKSQTFLIENKGQVRINTSGLSGIYFIQIESENGRRYTEKLYF